VSALRQLWSKPGAWLAARLSIDGRPEIDQAIHLENLRNHWQLDIWSIPGQLIALAAMSRVIAKTSLGLADWGGPVALLLITWAWGSLSLHRLRRVRMTVANYPLWRGVTLLRELTQSIGWGWLGAVLWTALAPQWHLLLLTGLIVFAYTAMFFTTDDSAVAACGNLPIVLILVARLLSDPSDGNGYVVLILVLSMITCLIVGRVLETRLMDAARLRIHNERLARELTEEVHKVRLARDEAEQANRQKSEFIAAASHDLRQPLHSLSLLSGLMEQSQRGQPQHGLAERMSAAVGALRVIFEQLFDIARVEANKLQHRPGPCSVQEIFDTLGNEFGLLCQQRHLFWQARPSDAWISADALFVQRILRNLLDNALRYTPSGGVVLRARVRGRHVVLQVWDSGIGIDPAEQGRIFDDYYQVGNPARRLREGLGLGLGLVRRLAQGGGYGLAVRSRPGRGSVFSLSVPRGRSPQALLTDDPALGAAAADAPQTASPHAPNRPVLFIDDEADVRDAVATVLTMEGWNCVVGETPEGVIEQVAVNDWWPCAVLCDYRLGLSLDGLQAIAQVRHEFGLSLPALLITGDLDPAIAERAHECGVALLRKPLSMDELLEALARALGPTAPLTRNAAEAGTASAASN
jgi:signal transduction histidine kinase/CheY-like chemotaxis protein